MLNISIIDKVDIHTRKKTFPPSRVHNNCDLKLPYQFVLINFVASTRCYLSSLALCYVFSRNLILLLHFNCITEIDVMCRRKSDRAQLRLFTSVFLFSSHLSHLFFVFLFFFFRWICIQFGQQHNIWRSALNAPWLFFLSYFFFYRIPSQSNLLLHLLLSFFY